MTKTQKAYQEYLETDTWKAIRRQRLIEDLFLCSCGNNASQVHHKRYPKVLGKENIDDLESVCAECHEIEHSIERQQKEAATKRASYERARE